MRLEEIERTITAFFADDKDLICDFCSSGGDLKEYPARDFEAFNESGISINSVGGWAACRECAALIDKGDREGLLRRSMQSFPGIEEDSEDMELLLDMSDAMKHLHKEFWSHRAGVNE